MLLQASPIEFSSYDVFIAGSGPAAAMLSARLSSGGKRCLVVETGGLDVEDRIQSEHCVMEGSGHFDGAHWPAHWIRTLGGTSSVWGGWCTPLLERNFRGWPIGRADLQPYYMDAARFLRRDVDFLDYGEPYLSGFDYRPFSDVWATRFGFAEDFPDYWEDERISVLLKHCVTRLLPEPDRRGIAGFSLYSVESDQFHEVPLLGHQKLVLAAGGMGNVQILLGSQTGEGPAVGNEHDQLGRGLQEHPHFRAGRLVVSTGNPLPHWPRHFGLSRPALVPSDALFDAVGPIDVSIGLEPANANDQDEIERFVIDRIPGGATVYDMLLRTEMAYDPENRVTRSWGRTPSDLPRLSARCVIGQDVFHTVIEYMNRLGRVLIETDAGRLRLDSDMVHRGFGGGGHTMGTTRMAASRQSGVVDGDCRVHGYRNLFVAGSSVFPTAGYAHPTFTILALSSRLADKILEEG
jgi:choline dehydrogenase-like flavoprotein